MLSKFIATSSSSSEILIQSSIKETNLEASLWIFEIKSFWSSLFTTPAHKSSEEANIVCNGVFNSWETLALNSLRSSSERAFSVISKKSKQSPRFFSPSFIGEITREYSKPFLEKILSTFTPSWALLNASRKVISRSSVIISLPFEDSSVLKRCIAELFIETITSSLFTKIRASLILSVMPSNSLFFASSSSILAFISFCWASIFTSSGDISS